MLPQRGSPNSRIPMEGRCDLVMRPAITREQRVGSGSARRLTAYTETIRRLVRSAVMNILIEISQSPNERDGVGTDDQYQ